MITKADSSIKTLLYGKIVEAMSFLFICIVKALAL